MNRTFSRVLFASLLLLCLTIENACQSKPSDSKANQQTSPAPKADLSNWQTVSLDGKGITFKLPPDWRHDGLDLESKQEKYTIQAVAWNAPAPDQAGIKILTSTYHTGFISLGGKAASRAEMLTERFDQVTKSANGDASYTDVKKLMVSGVEGVFRNIRSTFEDKDIGLREATMWTGYRTYQGKAQEVEIIMVGGNPKSSELLRTIFSTLELEQDKGAIPKP